MRKIIHLGTVLPATLVALAAVAACGGGATRAPVAPVAAAPRSTSCARMQDAASAPKPVLVTRAGSSVALATVGGKTIAYVADEDDQSVHAIDVDGQKDLGSTPLGGKPAQLMFLADGRLVVAVRDKAQLAVLDPGADPAQPMAALCAVPTDAEPFGLASTPDDTKLVATTGWGRSLTAFDAKSPTMAKSWGVALPREPRSVVIADDGARAFVSQAVGGEVSVVDMGVQRVIPTETHLTQDNVKATMKSGAMKENAIENLSFGDEHGSSCQGFSLAKSDSPQGRLFVPQAMVDPGDPNANPSGYGSPQRDQTEAADVAVIDEANGSLLLASLDTNPSSFVRQFGQSSEHKHLECLLPRSAAYDAKHGSLLVGCYGVDAVVAYDALAASPVRAEKRRWPVASGPSGIAVDPAKERAVVWSQFERTLDVLPLGGPALIDEKGSADASKMNDVVRVAAAPMAHPLPMSLSLGRALFHMSGDERISHDGRACASCHPDGRDDALTWATPNGPRRSIMLAGRVADTAPFSWSGSEHTLKEHMGITFSRLEGTGGLRGLELDALADYVSTLAPPPQSAPNPADATKIARGNTIFHSEAAGCSGCHAGDIATDNEHHDVQSKAGADKNGNFNTPTLRFVGGGGPYFHDGRYKTLHQLLTDADRKMGHTAQLSPDDLEALEAYLRTL
jgi:DNA-binding beta-propeller fold protein YncE/mono/diheme cytochrome c family protein